MPIVGYARLIGATADQAEAVINELSTMHICDRTESYGNITLQNRRMVRYENERKQGALRAASWRERKTNAKVTFLSSKSSKPAKPSASKQKPSLSRLPPDDAIHLAGLLRDLTVQNGAKPPTDERLQAWAVEAALMLRIDERDRGEAEAILRWCQADPFWRSNILGMPKFRKQYDQLKLKMESVGNHEISKRNSGRGEGVRPDRYAADSDRQQRQLAKLGETETGSE